MAYKGYLIKVGTYTIPFDFILASTFKCGINGQDLDSTRNANGILKRDALENEVIQAEWDVPAPIREEETRLLMDKIQAQYSNKRERKALVKAWMPEIGEYVTMDCYMTPNLEYSIQYADEKEVVYDSFHLKFIGYGGKVR